MLKLYGTPQSRAFRCLWMLEECQVAFELVEVPFATASSNAGYLKLNPNGQVPLLVDGDEIVFESFAINVHLAEHYAPSLLPRTDNGLARLTMWTAWAMAELEGPHDAANRAGTIIDAERLNRNLAALRAALDDEFLFGSHFSVVDLNLASVLLRPQYRKVAAGDPEIGPWFERCLARDAWSKVRARMA